MMPLMTLDTAEYLYISLFDKNIKSMISAQKVVYQFLYVPTSTLA